jgi:hypothetical protein
MRPLYWLLAGSSFILCEACNASAGDASLGDAAEDTPSQTPDAGEDVAASPATPADGDPDSPRPPSGSEGRDNEAGSGGAPGSGDFCRGHGPIVEVPRRGGAAYETCSGRIAEAHFQNALCTCRNASLAGYLRVRGFDSRNGAYVEGEDEGGAAVGINGSYALTAGYTDVAGSFAVAGKESVSFAGYLKVLGDFRAQGNVTVAGYTRVERDAWLGGEFLDLGPLTVKRNLTYAETVTAIPVSVGGRRELEEVRVTPPCPCEEEELLNVGALVDAARTHNDNAAQGLHPRLFEAVIGNVEATLPCGRYFVSGMNGIGNIRLNVTGRVALFVDGSLATTGNFEVRLAKDAELDLFVRENVVLTGRAVFGSEDRPAASRVYVGGAGDVLLTGAGRFVGNVYAPRSTVTAVGFADVYGSVFAKDFISPGYARFTYDRAIQHAGDSCDAPQPPAGSCRACGTCTGGTACANGACGACEADTDCCGQQVCLEGKCRAYEIG